MSEHSSTPTVPATSASDLLEHDLEHEQVVFANDPASGLRAIIAIHSTALGPSLGGTRFHPYASTADALSDVLALSRGMSYKAAVAGLDLGGGKAVIIGNPATQKTEALLRAYGRFVESLAGRYITACDVGTFSEDMDVVARESSYVTGRSEAHGGAGDSSVLTAYGVFCGLRAAAEAVWGDTDPAAVLAGRTVGVAGVGKVGRHLVGHLVDVGADVVITDVSPAAIAQVRDEHPTVRVAESTAALVGTELDVYAPCALGGALTDDGREHPDRPHRLRRRQQPARPPGRREAGRGPRHRLRARLRRQLRRPDPGGRRARGLQLRAGPGPGRPHLRHDPQRARARPQRGRAHRDGGRSGGRAADARDRPAHASGFASRTPVVE